MATSASSTCSTSTAASGENVYEVEEIVDIRERNDGSGYGEYRIRWKNCPPEDDTWEPEENLLSGCRDLVLAFERKQKLQEEQRQQHQNDDPEQQMEEPSELMEMSVMEEDEGEEEENKQGEGQEKEAANAPVVVLNEEEDIVKDSPDGWTAAEDTAEDAVDKEKNDDEDDKKEEGKAEKGDDDDDEEEEEDPRKLLKDPFWHDLEQGNMDVVEDVIYTPRQTRRTTRNASSTTKAAAAAAKKASSTASSTSSRGSSRGRGGGRGGGKKTSPSNGNKKGATKGRRGSRGGGRGRGGRGGRKRTSPTNDEEEDEEDEEDEDEEEGSSTSSSSSKKDTTPPVVEEDEEEDQESDEMIVGDDGYEKEDSSSDYEPENVKIPSTIVRTRRALAKEKAEEKKKVDVEKSSSSSSRNEGGEPNNENGTKRDPVQEVVEDIRAAMLATSNKDEKQQQQPDSKDKEHQQTDESELDKIDNAIEAAEAETKREEAADQSGPSIGDVVEEKTDTAEMEEKKSDASTATKSQDPAQTPSAPATPAVLPSTPSSASAPPSEAASSSTASSRPKCDEKLPMEVSTELTMDQFVRDEMKAFQSEKGRAVSQDQLVRAVQCGNAEIVRFAVRWKKRYRDQYRINANFRDSKTGNTLLIQVRLFDESNYVAENVMEAIKPTISSNIYHKLVQLAFLLLFFQDMNAKNGEGKTALHLAVENRQLCQVMKLLACGACVNIPDLSGATPMISAVRLNSVHIIHRLLEAGADIQAQIRVAKPNTSGAGGSGGFETISAKDIAVKGTNRRVIEMIDKHSSMLKNAFDKAFRAIAGSEMTIKSVHSPLHCFGLAESSRFRVHFDWVQKYLPNSRYGYILVCAIVRLHGTEFTAKMWGTSPVERVTLNGEVQQPLQDGGTFIFTAWPLKEGGNEIIVQCYKDARDSRMKLITQVLLVSLKSAAGPSISAMGQGGTAIHPNGGPSSMAHQNHHQQMIGGLVVPGEEQSGFARIY